MNLSDYQARSILHVLWNRCPVGIALLTQDGHFKYANPAFCDLLEYSEFELMKLSYRDITHPLDQEASEMAASQIIRGEKKEENLRKRYITKTGKVIYMLLRVSACKIENKFEFFVSQISDIKLVEIPRNPYYNTIETISIWDKILYLFRKNWVVISTGFAGLWVALKELPAIINNWLSSF